LYVTGLFGRVEDFDVTFSTRHEEIETSSGEGLHLSLKLSVIYRPVVGELYDLDADIGLNYYDEVIGPEFRSAARGVFARHSYLDLLKQNEAIEDEIEADLRRRTAGKHVEISSVTLEALDYSRDISKAVQDKLAAEQDALRQRTILENEDARKRMQIKNEDEQARIREEAMIRQKKQETELAKHQAELDRVREQSAAEKGLIAAKAEAEQGLVTARAAAEQAKAKAEETRLLAHARAEEARAANQSLTPLAVMMHGYDALKALGGTDTHIMIGDWSKLPNFLFPPAFQSTLSARKAEPAAAP